MCELHFFWLIVWACLFSGIDLDKIPFVLEVPNLTSAGALSMPQMQLPIFPEGVTQINSNLGVIRKGNTVTYIYGSLPVFSHHVNDKKTFKMFTSQLYVNGSAKQAEICRALGISKISMKRWVKLFREKGAAGFFEEPRRRGPAVLTPPVIEEVQELLDNGYSIPDSARKLDLKIDTLRKAILAGRLHKPEKKRVSSGSRREGRQ
jgi:transposase-like protein